MISRIIHIVESVTPSAGSISYCLPGLLNALAKSGIEGTIIDSLDELASQISRSSLVHIHGWKFPLSMHAARAARQAGTPYVLSPLGQLTPDPSRRKGLVQRIRNYFGERPLIRRAAAVNALNESDLNFLREGQVHSNLHLLPYGIDFLQDVGVEQSNQTDSQESRNLLMLDSLDPRFGCVVLLKAFAELGTAADGWTVTLAGDDRGHWRDKLEAAVRRKGGEARVAFDAANSPEAQIRLLRRATALVAPSLHVSPAVSIMRAVDTGVPVVATKFVALPGLNGAIRICGPGRGELRDALHGLIETPPSQRRASALAARVKAREVLDWSVLAPQYAELYAQCSQN